MERLAAWHRRLVRMGPLDFRERLICALLKPLSWLYGAIGSLRVLMYRLGFFPVYRAEIPVISVGNLAVGGTGKTPMVDYLVKLLQARGMKVAVVSRGYRGRVRDVGVVSAGEGPLLDPEICGDEPFLLARRNPRAVVLAAPRRAAGVRLAAERFGAEVVVLDDGFQHLAVHRDLDIVLLDAQRPLGNGLVLPAGLLREFPRNLRRGGLLVLTRSRGDEKMALLPMPVLRCRHVLSEEAFSLGGEVIPLAELAGKKGIAFAGIADPEGFFDALRGSGLSLKDTVVLPDHVAYDIGTLNRIGESCSNADFLVTTEKDGVKLKNSVFSVPCYQVPMKLEFFDSEALEQVLESLLN